MATCPRRRATRSTTIALGAVILDGYSRAYVLNLARTLRTAPARQPARSLASQRHQGRQRERGADQHRDDGSRAPRPALRLRSRPARDRARGHPQVAAGGRLGGCPDRSQDRGGVRLRRWRQGDGAAPAGRGQRRLPDRARHCRRSRLHRQAQRQHRAAPRDRKAPGSRFPAKPAMCGRTSRPARRVRPIA